MRGIAWMLVGGVVVVGIWIVGCLAAATAVPLGGHASAAGLAGGVGVALILPLLLSRRIVRALADRTPRRGPIHGATLVLVNAAVLGLLLGVASDRARDAVATMGDWPLFGIDVPILSDAWASHARAHHQGPSLADEPVTLDLPVALDAPDVRTSEPAPPPEPLNAAGVFSAAADSVVVLEVEAPAEGPMAELMPVLRGHGSGFVVGPDLVVSNFHVAGSATSMAVRTRDGRRLAARRVANLASDDLVLLRVDGLELPSLSLAEGAIDVGETTWAIGAPLGLEYSLTEGIVSGRRDVSGTPFIQMQTTVAPGSSGGPLLDDHARVVGVTTAVASPGLSLAVDVRQVEALLAAPRTLTEPLPLLPKPIQLTDATLPDDLMPTQRQQVEALLETLTGALSAHITLDDIDGVLELAPRQCHQQGLVADCDTLQKQLGFLSVALRMLPGDVHATFVDVPRADGGTGRLELTLRPGRTPEAPGVR